MVPERPEGEKEYLILLKNTRQTLHGIHITMKGKNINLVVPVSWKPKQKLSESTFGISGTVGLPLRRNPCQFQTTRHFICCHRKFKNISLVEFAAAGTPERWLIPDKTAMDQNYPNPFNPETWIPYQLAEDSEVSITIYDATGTIVRSLPLGLKPAGYYTDKERAAYWDGRNTHGETLASGLYFYQLKTDQISLLRKMGYFEVSIKCLPFVISKITQIKLSENKRRFL